jgi:hypothetical protein
VDCGGDESLNITDEVTVMAWIKLTGPAPDRKIAGNQDGVTGGYKFGVYSNMLEFEIRTADNMAVLNRSVGGGTILEQGVYHHVAGVYSSQGGYIRTYVNGVLDRELSTTAALGTSTGTFKIGREPFSDSYFWLGFMDDLRVYNRALTQDEIWAIAQGEESPFASDPNPEDGAVIPRDTWVTLSWTVGAGAVLYDVYFGVDYSVVANADPMMSDVYLGRVAANSYDIFALERGVTYYWRIDEIGADGTIYKGTVWNFTVTPEEGWVPFIPEAESGAVHDVKLKASDNTGITIDSDIPGMYVSEVSVDGDVYQKLTIPYAGHTTEIGKPETPIVRRYLEIPYDVNVTVEVIYSDFKILEGYNVYPAQKPFTGHEIPEFVIDPNAYSTNTFYPTEIAFVEEPIIMRGHRIVTLALCPVQYNPETRQLRVYSKIEARIGYDRPAQIEGIEERLESEAFESLCKSFVLNYKRPEEYLSRRYKDVGSPSVDYLIITHNNFNTQVQPLADWKEKKGLRTQVVSTTTICTDPAIDDIDEITDYIQKAYDTWNPAPTYVLLVGDSDFIPTHYRTVHPAADIYGNLLHGGHTIATDLYYATTDGTDRFADILIGRISVDTTAQTTIIVNKILDYEKSPPTDAGFYTNMSLCAYFQDNDPDGAGPQVPDNREDTHAYITTSMDIFDFLSNTYTIDRIYSTNAANPAQYNDTTNLPNDLLMTNGFLWDGDTADITNAINAGRFIVNHNDHGVSENFRNHLAAGTVWGSFDGWDEPRFTTADILGLTNDLAPNVNEFPVVFSINCMTGWFDGETDAYTTRSFESFCEEIVRYQNGGAVAAIGATRASFTLWEFELCKGLFDAIWPNFDPTITTGSMYELGLVLTYGKVYMAGIKGMGTATDTQLEQFHLFGDPEMSIWTEQPPALDLDFPSTIGSGGLQEFVVTVKDDVTKTPIPGAAVCVLKKDDNLQSAGYTNPSGNMVFRVTPSTAGNMDLTVTKHNYRPTEETMAVTDNGATITVSPDIGPPNTALTITGSSFGPGETVNIDFGSTSSLWSAQADAFGSFTITSGVTVPSGATACPTNVVAKSSTRTAIAVFNVLSAQQQPDPYIYCQWDPMTWNLHPTITNKAVWDNPCIELRDQSTGNVVPSGQLKIGTTYTIEATIHNNSTTADAVNTNVDFRWALWGMGQKVWNYVDADLTTPAYDPATVNVPTNPGTVTATVQWTPITTGHCCIVVEVHHPWDSNLKNNMGQENTDVHPITSPAEIFIDVQNPTDTPGLVYLEITQGTPGEQLELWETRIERPYPQVLEPNEVQTATLLVDAPDGVEIGETRTISVTGTIDGEIIGGVEIQVVKVVDGLVAHYAFEQDTTDSSGNGLDGSVIGDPAFVDGVEGMALDFNGDVYVDCGGVEEFSFTDAMTVSTWVNIRSVTTAWMAIIAKGENAWRLSINNQTTGIHYAFTGEARGWLAANTATELSFDEWYHVAATYDTNVGALVYINGVLDASNPNLDGIDTNEMPLLLGENPEATGRLFDGMLDEVKIYNRALTEGEIRDLAGLR